jgi:hypothetical protein
MTLLLSEGPNMRVVHKGERKTATMCGALVTSRRGACAFLIAAQCLLIGVLPGVGG